MLQLERNEEINGRSIQIERIDKRPGDFLIALGNAYLVAGDDLHCAAELLEEDTA